MLPEHEPEYAAGRVSVIIPTRDSQDRLSIVLAGLSESSWDDLEVVIVDNGSSDESALRVIAESGAKVLRRNFPFNFSRLINSGASAATGEYLLLLNDDVEVLDQDWIARLVARAKRPGVGPVGAALFYPDGRVQHCGIDVVAGSPQHLAVGALPNSAPRDLLVASGPRWAVTGACLMIRSALFSALGGLDTMLHTSYNDVDLCLRSTRIGAIPHLEANVRLIHHESATRGQDPTPDVQADWLMFRTRWARELASR